MSQENCPEYIKPVTPQNLRRATWHDYRSPSIYMVTLNAAQKGQPFGTLQLADSPHSAYIKLNTLGNIISEHIRRISSFYPDIRILNSVIMPDHCHILICVYKKMEKPLGTLIRAFTSSVTSKWKSGSPVFKKGYNDRIVSKTSQLNTLIKYINDNPFRLAMRKLHPDLFRRYLHIRVSNREYAAYGNIFLLKESEKHPVIVHTKYNIEEKRKLYHRWLECAANEGVLVSPFISKEEKIIRSKALEAGGKIIQIKHDGLPDRFKPTGKDFDLCTEGRLLILAPWPETKVNLPLSRSRALSMNMLAREIVSQQVSTCLIRNKL